MFAAQRNMPEIRHLSPAQKKAALQAAFGAVSARPVFYCAMAAIGGSVAVGMAVGESIGAGWPGRIAGAVIGALVGSAIHDRIMRRAMRPHLLAFLADNRDFG